jgi:hypothetical protein
MTPPALVYLGMGMLLSRILLDGTQTRGYSSLQWMQFLFNVVRITLLWPLVLLIEKVEVWLKSDTEMPMNMLVSEKNVQKNEERSSDGAGQ